MKFSLIAVLFGALALFSMPAFAQTAYPPGENVDCVIQGQHAENIQALEIGYIHSVIAIEKFTLHEFTEASASLVKVEMADTFTDKGAAVAGGVACLACTEPGKGSSI